ncbi:pyridoxamine 5'-phosphate oxidase family protein [Terracoccus luteus]|jgi:nitroimidazol reductase NimA-like FMN-containing flavoprotein (pyridoxamine 5'-phosphate oxidase superfamily)|uniref:Nitroimidazol reductase NimA-like FMN-containing flavoprotein (Pyridoxamine 5'-phosphate oxidase superfamily) n=1 Tax=Terracoccus luteus TaxID=53356 RepID=A0A495Y063_9MICO|nr:pyridoxamine 5'-phosphate oxidase family protein [Terracoccus luteus]MBB2988324.1 nitroimidazol reductase NimA-like FMN-containing flavoprotein (pyridoxamine 5'-phosphate oxidase superfamily) [Terracoccus luteus]MCP2173959.1 nitroimidazol reductase NimA-like FMN-containing flavoprotein (pyridoxamine 5'-phosphate oxidase superfamily) [Terracoccus luteus]RKT79582.1 pyridoxamine 5'-phosphate oxidase-like protein [Terracoccus luteus]
MTVHTPPPRSTPSGAPTPSHSRSTTQPTAPAVTTEVLTVPECWTLLRAGVIGRLAVATDDGPDIFPVNYTVEHGSVVFRTDAGRKLTMARHQAVAFEIDSYDTTTATASSVVLRGRADEIRDTDEIVEAMALPLLPWQDGPKARYVRIVPHSTTGRRIHVAGVLHTPFSR